MTLRRAVLVGVLLSGVFFASKVRSLFGVTSELAAMVRREPTGSLGEVFFASVERFIASFDFREVIEKGGDRRSPRTLLGHLGSGGAGQGRAQVPT